MRKAYEIAFARWWLCQMESSARRRLWIKLSKLLYNGVPIMQGLETMHKRRLESNGRGDALVIALETWLSGMSNGQRLSELLAGWASPVEIMLIAAGESTGTLEEALLATSRVMDAQTEIRSAVIKGVSYPIILLMVAFGVMYMFGFKVVPEFTKIIAAERFHGLAQVLIGLSKFAQNWLVVTGGVVLAALGLLFYSFPRWDGALRIRLDRYAPYSVYRVVVGSTWLIGLASMLEAGIRLENAMEKLSSLADPWLKARIDAASIGMRAGLSLGDSLQKNGYEFPDREIIDDLGVYSSLSGFDEAIAIIGREWLTESVAQIKVKMTVVFGVSLLTVAVLIGTMVGGMMNMQLQMSQMIQQRSR